MTTALFVAGYVLGGLVMGRIAYVVIDSRDPLDDEMNMFLALWIGLFWPVAGGLVSAYWLLRLTLWRETPRQRRERLVQEWESTRIEAAKHGLPAPEVKA